ncbi:hypothetical protein HPB52_005341 [Rhipicephalus sanguineus]|uniref:Uncharacterized protein n=1 Tax=Rhipicephalus sanguineus TaxID=34632 RepID=A0A9D4Q7B1_RHISA|nr:hypothetical protein HPB52_005341 [Rhipicephalus sanguineus]
MALRFYGAETLQTVTGDLVRIPQSTVCRAVGKVTLLIAKHLYSMLVRFPQAAGFPKVMRDFYEVAEFPGVTACVACTHVRINSPGGDDAEVFRNRKGYFSFNVQEPEPPAQRVPQPSSNITAVNRTVHLPPVDRLNDSYSGMQARDLLIRKSFT